MKTTGGLGGRLYRTCSISGLLARTNTQQGSHRDYYQAESTAENEVKLYLGRVRIRSCCARKSYLTYIYRILVRKQDAQEQEKRRKYMSSDQKRKKTKNALINMGVTRVE